MATPLLTTKLYVPPVRRELVPRPRLVGRLNAGLRHKLTLISAAAGFGKTTLLSAWLADLETRFAWLSLDEGDNDFARFFSYLIAALQGFEPQIGEGLLSTLQSLQPSAAASASRPGADGMEELLTTLLNQINAVPDDFVLVLDDYHMIEARPVHDALAFLLAHLPRQMHLVIATRVDPPLPLTLLRGRGQLNELRQTDLRFTPDEVAQFLAQIAGMTLPSDDVAALVVRTEGWVAGLQMAALSIRGRDADQVANFIASFTGSNRYVLDYLIKEVLERQPQDVQTFLLKTSVLDRLTGPLCDALLKVDGADTPAHPLTDALTPSFTDSSSQATLAHLERANLFIVPLDDRREWYRYHHLFAELLQQRLSHIDPALMQALHRRASAWYKAQGEMDTAITHALAACDVAPAADLIQEIAEATLMRGEFATLLHWVEALPADVTRARPRLGIYHLTVTLLSGRPLEELASHLQIVTTDEADDLVSAAKVAFQAVIAILKGDVESGVADAQRALALLPEENLFFRSFVVRSLGVAHRLTGDAVASFQTLQEALRIAQKAGDRVGKIIALHYSADARMVQARLHEAHALWEQSLELTTDAQGQRMPAAIKPLTGMAGLLYEWNDLESATALLSEAVEVSEKWEKMWGLGIYMILARVKQAQGDPAGARRDIETAYRFALTFDMTDIDDFLVAAHQARLWVAQGDLDAATRWAEERGLIKTGEPTTSKRGPSLPPAYYLHEIEQSTLARLYLAQTRSDAALQVLDPVIHAAQKLGRTGNRIEFLALQALAWQLQEDLEGALDRLGQALALAEPQGYVRLFVDEGPPMARLLSRAAARGIAPRYVSRLLEVFPEAERPSQAPPPDQAGLIEPLSERELEVLQLLPTPLSSSEIAEQLYISVHTVRSHIKNIYGKLGVHSRHAAIARAEILGLLP